MPPTKASLFAAMTVVAGSMVGIGVFTSLGYQVQALPAGFPVILLWLAGGLLAFCGAVSYAELTAAYPQSGGEYQLLGRIYHPGVGFVSGWISLTVGFPAPVALAALIFGRTFWSALGMEDSDLAAKALATVVVLALTGVHLISVAFSGRFQGVTTALKILFIAALAVCGFVIPAAQPVAWLPAAGDFEFKDFAMALPAFFGLLVFVLYAYNGWNTACYIAGEVEQPERNVPRALFLGTGIVTVLYVALNAAMMNAAPAHEMAQHPDNLPYIVATHIFGDSGGRLIAMLIAFGLISSMSAMIWAGPRVTQQMGRDYPMLRMLAVTTPRGVPWLALLLQSALVLLIIFAGDLQAMVTGHMAGGVDSLVQSILQRTEFCLQLSLLLTVFGVMMLRWTRPDLPRPFRAWGYPVTPLLFITGIAITLSELLKTRPDETRQGLAIVFVGAILYWLARPPAGEA